jgi:hypothetical protein
MDYACAFHDWLTGAKSWGIFYLEFSEATQQSKQTRGREDWHNNLADLAKDNRQTRLKV